MYILIMIFTFSASMTPTSSAVIQQEYSSEAACKAAAQTIERTMQGPGVMLRQSSCTKK